EPVVEEALDVVERVRPLLVAGELDGAPDLLVGRVLAHPVELTLKPVELSGEPGTAEQGHVAQPTQPLAQAQLVLRWGHRTASGAVRASGGARAAGRSRRGCRSGSSA